MMFDSLSDRLSDVFKRFSGKGKLSKEDVEAGLREVRLALLEADVNFKVARAFVERIRERAVQAEVLESLTPGQTIVSIVNEELTALLGGEQRKLRYQSQPPTVVMLLGLQGSGKTTTAAKLALAVRKEGHRPLMVAADTYRPAAAQQLERLGKDNQVPVAMPDGKSKPPELCKRGVDEAKRLNCDVVILDTAGRLQIDQTMLDELKEIRRRVTVHDTVLVVDAMTGQEAVNVAKAFEEAVGVDGIILTKLDGDARGGAALSMRESIGKPIMYSGIGEKVSEFEAFAPDRMASRILGMGDILTLIERAQEHVDEKHAEEMVERSLAGKLTMEDWLAQMRQLRSMGPLEGVLGMIPGGKKLLTQAQQQGGAIPGEQDIKRMEAIVLSMTTKERRHPEVIKGSRRKRIAAGSGTSIADVNKMLKGFEQMQSVMKMLGGGKGTKGMRGKARMLKQLRNMDTSQLPL
ncbi:MAG: signal recognition particle protein [Candidatus Dormibacteraeota bacterium]|nr:signal recognition particle protein [Candidatus Dormibacteraeota bacterium]